MVPVPLVTQEQNGHAKRAADQKEQVAIYDWISSINAALPPIGTTPAGGNQPGCRAGRRGAGLTPGLGKDLCWLMTGTAQGLVSFDCVFQSADGVLHFASDFSALPSASSLASPTALPTASLTLPLTSFAEPSNSVLVHDFFLLCFVDGAGKRRLLISDRYRRFRNRSGASRSRCAPSSCLTSAATMPVPRPVAVGDCISNQLADAVVRNG